MRVLVTRAIDDAARTRDKLQAAGHEVVLAPVIEIASLPVEWPSGCVDGVLATSAKAFAGFAMAGPAPEARRLIPLFVVGDRTLAEARNHGFAGPAVVKESAAALALALGTRALVSRRLAYLAGRDRKADLEAAIDSMARQVVVLEVYDARAARALPEEAEQALRDEAIDVALHYSRRSATLFAKLARERSLDLARLRHLCLSDDVATPLRERDLQVEIAAAPNEAALLDTLPL